MASLEELQQQAAEYTQKQRQIREEMEELQKEQAQETLQSAISVLEKFQIHLSKMPESEFSTRTLTKFGRDFAAFSKGHKIRDGEVVWALGSEESHNQFAENGFLPSRKRGRKAKDGDEE